MALTYQYKSRSADSLTHLRARIRKQYEPAAVTLQSHPDDATAIDAALKLLEKMPGPCASCAVKRRNANAVLGWWLKGRDGGVRWEKWEG